MQDILLHLNKSLYIKRTIYISLLNVADIAKDLYINELKINEFIIISHFMSYFVRVFFLKRLQEYHARAKRILLPYMMPVAT